MCTLWLTAACASGWGAADAWEVAGDGQAPRRTCHKELELGMVVIVKTISMWWRDYSALERHDTWDGGGRVAF
jgi:hypothetical protein